MNFTSRFRRADTGQNPQGTRPPVQYDPRGETNKLLNTDLYRALPHPATSGSASTRARGARVGRPRPWRMMLTALGVGATVVAGGAASAVPADAAAFSYGVYAPNKVSSTTMEAWANLSRDCSGTYGCYNYFKIEKREWWGWSFQNGGWANNNGWNSIQTNIQNGCGNYRLTVDSYNDVAGGYGSGVNIGPVGASGNGTKIYRYRTTWSSGTKQICRG